MIRDNEGLSLLTSVQSNISLIIYNPLNGNLSISHNLLNKSITERSDHIKFQILPLPILKGIT